MNLKELSKEELESMSYDDIAFALLTEKKDAMKIIDLFNEIGKLVGLSTSIIEEKIADFFEMLTLDKRFIMLDDGSWDLKTRHAQKIVLDEEEEDVTVEDLEESEEETEEEIFYEEDEDNDTEDDLKDLVVIDEDEEEGML